MLVLAGIDEAGYGPLLGPLCVASAAFRVHSWSPGEPAPDLWKLLSPAVAPEPGDKRDRIPVADSKRLKLSNSLKRKHPLTHLERGVLAFLGASGVGVDSDAALFGHLGVEPEPHAWYAGERALPLARTSEQLAIDAAQLTRAMEKAGVELLELRCAFVGESAFNETVRRTNSKAETTAQAVGAHLRRIAERYGGDAEATRVVCDRLGGRTDYARVLARELNDDGVRALEVGARASRYELPGAGVRVTFMPEAETWHLPVALASMVAKLVRELSMARFNAYWGARMPELKPTAGYRQDAHRWLQEAEGGVTPDERRAMVRLA